MVDADKSTQLLNLFSAGVDAVLGDRSVERSLTTLLKSDAPSELKHAGHLYLVAVGKAASAMTEGALRVVGDRVESGVVVTKYAHLEGAVANDPRFTCIESAHPVPDENSLLAGRVVRDFVADLPEDAVLLFLLSGGASALLELLPEGMTLKDLQAVNEHLLGTGLDIIQMNEVRSSLSIIKGGKLANHHAHSQTVQLLISDVPGDRLASIGSGPLVPPAAGKGVAVPEWLQKLKQQVQPAPSPDDPVWSKVRTHLVASNAIACEAVVAHATNAGFTVCQPDGLLQGDVEAMAVEIAATLLSENTLPGVYVWGGETTVVLPESPGRGGRNQQLALYLAKFLRGTNGLSVLVAGTDGTDGPTEDAGAIVDGRTVSHADSHGVDVDDALQRADAGSLFAQTGSLVTTGPTGTNVMDLVIAIKEDV